MRLVWLLRMPSITRLISFFLLHFQGLHIDIIKSDFSTFALSNFSFVVVYLGRSGNSVVKNKLTKECTAGTTVISVGVSSDCISCLCLCFSWHVDLVSNSWLEPRKMFFILQWSFGI